MRYAMVNANEIIRINANCLRIQSSFYMLNRCWILNLKIHEWQLMAYLNNSDTVCIHFPVPNSTRMNEFLTASPVEWMCEIFLEFFASLFSLQIFSPNFTKTSAFECSFSSEYQPESITISSRWTMISVAGSFKFNVQCSDDCKVFEHRSFFKISISCPHM